MVLENERTEGVVETTIGIIGKDDDVTEGLVES